VIVEDIGVGEMVIEFVSEIEMSEEGGRDAQWRHWRDVDDISKMADSKMFENALHVAGFDVRDEDVEVEVEVGMDTDGKWRRWARHQMSDDGSGRSTR
jgi:hypothetical protein